MATTIKTETLRQALLFFLSRKMHSTNLHGLYTIRWFRYPGSGRRIGKFCLMPGKLTPNPTMQLHSGIETNGNVNEIFQMFWKFWLKWEHHFILNEKGATVARLISISWRIVDSRFVSGLSGGWHWWRKIWVETIKSLNWSESSATRAARDSMEKLTGSYSWQPSMVGNQVPWLIG